MKRISSLVFGNQPGSHSAFQKRHREAIETCHKANCVVQKVYATKSRLFG